MHGQTIDYSHCIPNVILVKDHYYIIIPITVESLLKIRFVLVTFPIKLKISHTFSMQTGLKKEILLKYRNVRTFSCSLFVKTQVPSK